ncbi:MAG: carbon-nitrogen hydrolase family protein [Alphaproteobacteria bacterium]|nr:carbon-nitrogen hydrolase family protein [Alphaproteobacteria bacterium]
MSRLKVACVQMRSGTDVRENIEAASILIREAATAGARLIATPEMTSLLDRKPGAVFARSTEENDDVALAAFRALAVELGVWLLIGSLPIRAGAGRCANRSFLISPDGLVSARYDKIHMFDVQLNASNVYRESDAFAAGSEMVLGHLPEAVLGMTVCYDVRFPDLFRALAVAGAQIIAVPAAFTRITGEAHWHVLLRARAIETGCFIIAPAQGGRHQDGRETFGHSLIIDPWGAVLSEGALEPGVIHATLDLDKVEEARRRIPSLTANSDYHLGVRADPAP